MSATNSLARWCWAALAFGTLGLQAQDAGISTAFKIRGLLSRTSKDQGMTNGVFGHGLELGYGFGFEAGYDLGAGKITGELGYSVASGDAYLGDLSQMQRSTSDTVINSSKSFESRKNKIDGLTFRLGYEAPLTTELSWRAGLQIGGTKFTHQVIGNINGTSGATSAPFSEAYVYVGRSNKLAPSPFGGLTYAFDTTSSLEVGVLLLQYTSLDYHHVANTNSRFDTVDEKKRVVPNFEFAYVFRF